VPPLTESYRSLFENDLPGPYVTARIGKGDGGEHRELLALLDSGSDITLLPKHTVDALDLQVVTDDVDIHDATGHVSHGVSMYMALVRFGLLTHQVSVSVTESAVAYIGRDILNDYVATFRGPAQAFTVE
jgi:hypothetical protein